MYITTYTSNSTFFWDQRQYKKAVSHHWNCNIPIVCAGYIWDSALVKHVHEASSLPAQAIPMTYSCYLATNLDDQAQEDVLELFYNGQIALDEIPKLGDTPLDMQLQKSNRKIRSCGKLLSAGQIKLLHWYGQLGHCTFKQIFKLDTQGHIAISGTAQKSVFPKCMSCIMGKAHCHAWKTDKSGKAICSRLDEVPDACLHINQLECSQPGLIPQIKGCL
jgi:hypothetical protein